MTKLMEHPDGDFKIEYEGENELLWVSGEEDDLPRFLSLRLTPLGLIDLGQRMVKEGVAIITANPHLTNL